ncbi:MAG: RNA polymerase sigma factor [Dehalococcoidia bacterium]
MTEVLEPPPAPEDAAVLAALRAGDEQAFTALVERYHGPMVRLATAYVPSYAVAEEVAQEAWLGVLNGIGRFEGRSSLKTWIFRILTNIAKTRGAREQRSLAFSSVFDDPGPDEPAVDADRFAREGHWLLAPSGWGDSPEEKLESAECQALIHETIESLPANQREVIRLRDVLGFTSAEVCNALEVSETNQRVLLHRARSRVRRALELYFEASAHAKGKG